MESVADQWERKQRGGKEGECDKENEFLLSPTCGVMDNR
jgi:hypothetical protein